MKYEILDTLLPTHNLVEDEGINQKCGKPGVCRRGSDGGCRIGTGRGCYRPGRFCGGTAGDHYERH